LKTFGGKRKIENSIQVKYVYIPTLSKSTLAKIKLRTVFKCGNYSRAETNQGRKLLIIRRFLLRKLFKGGNYSRAETIRGNTVTFYLLLDGNFFKRHTHCHFF